MTEKKKGKIKIVMDVWAMALSDTKQRILKASWSSAKLKGFKLRLKPLTQ